MSRVDEALRALERAAAAAPVAPEPEMAAGRSERLTLRHFPAESTAARALYDGQDIAPTQPAPKGGSPESRHKLIGRGMAPVQIEQYRRLAAALHDAQVERELKTVMITSAVPREGKTLTALNLALTLSESFSRRVLLVDADLRWPSVHEVLGLPNTRGLSDVLNEDAPDIPFIEMTANWTVLTAGHAGPNPLVGLTSERMGILLDEFESRFDWILLDTPPVGLLPDARLLARLIRSVVFVIGARSTPAQAVERAVAELGSECILGTVLNRIADEEIPDAGYYYGGSKSAARVS
jgi:protein-tyrosine kinase